MKKIFIISLGLLLSSCNILEMNNNTSIQQPSINLENQPEISLPYTVGEIESEYEQIKITSLSPVDPSLDNIYYVKIFLTNENMFDTLLQYYIPVSELPLAELETDENRLEMANQTGVITYAGYTNVIAVYGIIHALHYNHFISNTAVYFSPLRTLDSDDLAAIEYEPSFIAYMDTQLSNQSLSSQGEAYKTSWPVPSEAPAQGAGIPRNQADPKYFAFRPQTDLYIHLSYKERSHYLHTLITAPQPLVGIQVNLRRALHFHWLETDVNGQAYVHLLRNKDYVFRIKMKSKYAKYTKATLYSDGIGDTSTGFAFVYIARRTIPDLSLAHMNHPFDDNITSVFGSFYEIYNFALSEGFTPPRVTYLFKDLGGGRAAESGIFRIRIVNISNVIKSQVAHEYGHFLHFRNSPAILIPFMWAATTGTEEEKLTYPDGNKSDVYYHKQLSFLMEGWADFFSLAFAVKTFGTYPGYIDQLYKNVYENNYGSKEIVFISDFVTNNAVSPIIGKYNNGSNYIYQYDFPRYYKEASILYDLWDDNDLAFYYRVKGGALCLLCGNTEYRLDRFSILPRQ